MNAQHFYFPNIGYTLFNFSEEELEPLKSEIHEIEKNNFKGIVFNHNLAGNIEKQFQLIKCKRYTQNLLLPKIIEFDKEFNYIKSIDILTNNCPLILDGLWVNFQSKYEFNPSHKHSGIFSFVIWIKIPYNIEEEKSNNSSKRSDYNVPGHFEFSYADILGKIRTLIIPTDKKFENFGILFPSNLTHAVYPFFSSDEYRISISGNFKFDNS
jgi:hypothetical protein